MCLFAVSGVGFNSLQSFCRPLIDSLIHVPANTGLTTEFVSDKSHKNDGMCNKNEQQYM